jgi:type I restriction enzyme, S subunit
VIKEIEVLPTDLEKYQLCAGDILLTEGGDWDKLGRSAFWENEIENCIHQNHVFRARPLHPGFDSYWAILYTNSPLGRQYFENAAKKTTNLASINMTQLRYCPVPIPPAAEQKRIVAKVNQLMALCDTLQAHLTHRQTQSDRPGRSRRAAGARSGVRDWVIGRSIVTSNIAHELPANELRARIGSPFRTGIQES